MDYPRRLFIRSAYCLLICFALVPGVAQAGLRLQTPASAKGQRLGESIYKTGWIDLNKNGKKDIYEDSTRPVEERVEDLLSQMNTQEKLAQLGCPRQVLAAKDCMEPSQDGFKKLAGSTICCFDQVPESKDRNTLQKVAIEHSRLGIPVMFGCDPGSVGSADTDCAQGVKVGLRLAKEGSVCCGKGLCEQKPAGIDDSVRKVLRTKFLRGLFDLPYVE